MKSVPQNLSIRNMKCDARVALNARARHENFSAKFRGGKNWRRRLRGVKKNFFQQNLISDV